MTLCGVVVMSTHSHLLLRPRDGQHLADFMCFLKTNVAKEIGGRIRGWPGPFFGRRYHSTTVSDEEAAQVGVLRYLLSHGPKEFLVDKVEQWPGVHCAASLMEGRPMIGLWYDRSAELSVRQRQGEDAAKPGDFVSQEVVDLSPLPCWQHLSEATWRAAVTAMVEDIDRQAAVERTAQGRTSLGVEGVLTQDPFARPTDIESSPQPRFHTATREAFETMLGIWREVVEAFYAASADLRAGNRDATFPEGTFPPALPFVPFSMVPGVSGARGHPG